MPALRVPYPAAMSSSNPKQALQRLRDAAETGELAEFCADHDVELLVAFGSATEPGRPAAPHDIDLAVVLGPRGDLVDLTGALMGWLALDEVDVMDLARAGTVARDQALRLGEPLHEARPGLFAQRQMGAMTARMDSAWLRRLSLEAMAR